MPAARLPGQIQQPVRHPQESPGGGEEDPQWCQSASNKDLHRLAYQHFHQVKRTSCWAPPACVLTAAEPFISIRNIKQTKVFSINLSLLPPSCLFISAASFSSLATGFRRTSSLDQRPEQTHITNGPADTETEPLTECPIHPSGAADCPVHPTAGDQGSSGCPLHTDEVDTTADCQLHSAGANNNSDCPVHTSGGATDCPMHSTGHQNVPGQDDCPLHGEGTQPKSSTDCPLHTSGVQISISAPEPDPEEEEAETGNHRPGDQGGGDTSSMTASRESLARYHGGDSGVGITSNNTLSHVPRTSVFKRPGRKRRHGDETFDHDISAFFPANLDFLALQEVFDHGSTTRLRRQLHRYFPYVLSDVGRYGWKGCCSRFKFLNSGLMLASRYPILDARYECYPNGRGEDALAAKGALFAKVRGFILLLLTLVLSCKACQLHTNNRTLYDIVQHLRFSKTSQPNTVCSCHILNAVIVILLNTRVLGEIKNHLEEYENSFKTYLDWASTCHLSLRALSGDFFSFFHCFNQSSQSCHVWCYLHEFGKVLIESAR